MENLGRLIWVAVITCFFSFGVQCGFYLFFRLKGDPIIKKYKTVVNYTSGMIGDGLLVPLVNVFAFLTLSQIGHTRIRADIGILGLSTGLAVTFIAHWGQKRFDQRNWTMTEKGIWNNLGLYHAFFMFFESSFLGYTLFYYLNYLFNPQPNMVFSPFWYAIVILLLFAASFIFDYWDCLFRDLLKRQGSKLFKNL